ncbi:hypothetical protein C9I98_11440 [Photobacterium sanctipauli]|uniref:CheW-like domain-containing protein n=1 Tax=Photobacterium sanctipauli TaxID=1342794 RepID=A0A2T3NTB5_9GAMM|nr:chemotaxis protein CheW [Photobacterium sanctipauli]PSW19523.1 hypothetical protein C9I98_11440 [Photobacterium sanctipauli]
MSDNARLSSEQALDDYFLDLLAEPELFGSAEEPPEQEASQAEVAGEPTADELICASGEAIGAEDNSEEAGHQDLPRPDHQEVSSPAGPIAPQEQAQPFDFDSLNGEGDHPEPALAPKSVLDIKPASEAQPASDAKPALTWYEPEPTSKEHLEDVQRLLSQMNSLLPGAQAQEQAEEPTETLSDEWQQVMAHEAESQPSEELELGDDGTGTSADSADEEAQLQASALETQAGDDEPPEQWHQQHQLGNEFQALFFEVNGVTFAVPLTELGGIHQLGEVNHLLGRPPWYLGLMTNRDHQLDVVDTARWVMPEKLADDEHREEYRYLVMLGESKWGLACNTLQGTENLTEHSVRWREKAGKRPWLAGMVKEKMCALIHVSELISMLNAGLDVKAVNIKAAN